MPLVHEVDRRYDDKRADAGVGDCFDGKERLPASSRENNASPSVVVGPRG